MNMLNEAPSDSPINYAALIKDLRIQINIRRLELESMDVMDQFTIAEAKAELTRIVVDMLVLETLRADLDGNLQD